MHHPTGPKKAQLLLERSEELFRTVADTAQDAVVIADSEGRVLFWNRSAERIFGYAAGEAVGREMHALIVPERLREAHLKGYHAFRNTGEGALVGRTVEVPGLRKDGTEIPVELSISAVQVQGKWCATGILRDISERHGIEAALHKSRLMLERLFEDAPDAIVVVDGRGTIRQVNRQAETLFGFSRAKLVGRRVECLIPVRFREVHRKERRRYFAQPGIRRMGAGLELFALHRGGNEIPVDIMLSPIRTDDGAWAFAVVRDITEAKRAEERIRVLNATLMLQVAELEVANARLKEMDRVKTMFIASMSHELRTPLNAIIGFSAAMADEWFGSLSAEQKENLGTVLRAGKHLHALISDVIDVSRIEAGELDGYPEEFDLHGVIAEAAQAVEDDLREKGLTFEVCNIHHTMYTDRQRLLQCLQHLLSNAVKFTEKGGVKVEVSSSGFLVPSSKLETSNPELETGSDSVLISVEDTGIGIDAEDREKIFEPFIRLQPAVSREIPGTGLGLFITRRIVREILRGEISLSGGDGAGTRFVIRIPSVVGELHQVSSSRFKT